MFFIWEIPQSKVWRSITGGSENLQKQENKKMIWINWFLLPNGHILIFWHWKVTEVFLFVPATAGNMYVVSLNLLIDKTSRTLIYFWGEVLTLLLITLFVRFFHSLALIEISFFDLSFTLSFNLSRMLLDNSRIYCLEKHLPSTLISEGL
jgi:hypothetical protein